MFTQRFRFVAAFLAIGLAGLSFYHGRQGGFAIILGFGYLVSAALLVWGNFRQGSTYLAHRALRRGDLERVRTLLGQISRPQWLEPQALAYYHWARGVILASDQEAEAAREELERASEGGLRTENDRCLVHCQLAALALAAADSVTARQHLWRARTYRRRAPADALIRQLDEQVRALE